MKELTTQELVNTINKEAMASFNNPEIDLGATTAMIELKSREADRGEYVRLSNLKKGSFGKKSYICGKRVDGVITSKFWEDDATKAKSYEKAF